MQTHLIPSLSAARSQAPDAETLRTATAACLRCCISFVLTLPSSCLVRGPRTALAVHGCPLHSQVWVDVPHAFSTRRRRHFRHAAPCVCKPGTHWLCSLP
ncbi:unnamed protein product [Prorocentrum cordatum]|uniref:Secreted protein n=1 Tax=Prorocentrum cordatum TaxID=2364126 RepID=A0ABN9RN80_9DINO|nr:unnamed protein product [Polarella glacialis]